MQIRRFQIKALGLTTQGFLFKKDTDVTKELRKHSLRRERKIVARIARMNKKLQVNCHI